MRDGDFKTLCADDQRLRLKGTGILVRALRPGGKFGPTDIAHLCRQSLLDWLRSRRDNRTAEDVVGILLGHGPLNPTPLEPTDA